MAEPGQPAGWRVPGSGASLLVLPACPALLDHSAPLPQQEAPSATSAGGPLCCQPVLLPRRRRPRLLLLLYFQLPEIQLAAAAVSPTELLSYPGPPVLHVLAAADAGSVAALPPPHLLQVLDAQHKADAVQDVGLAAAVQSSDGIELQRWLILRPKGRAIYMRLYMMQAAHWWAALRRRSLACGSKPGTTTRCA